MNTGKLLPEDRELWYSNIVNPLNVADFDDNLSFKLSLYEQYRSTGWFSVDIFSLTVETFVADTSSASSALLSSAEERTKQTAVGEASWYKSLDWRQCQDDEFSFNFSNVSVVIGTENFPVRSLRDAAYFYFPDRVVSYSHKKFRGVAREARAHRAKLREIEDKKQREREEQKRKQQAELQQKQKDLVQLALKRAQNVQSKKPAAPSPPPKPTNPWSSAAATAVAPQPVQQNLWSSRPMVPPAMPAWSTAMPLLIAPALGQAAPHDPWSAANVWAEPSAKRVKTPPDEPSSK